VDRAEAECFADGPTQDVTTQLARSHLPCAVAGDPSERRGTDVKHIGERLSVRYVLEGSCVTAQTVSHWQHRRDGNPMHNHGSLRLALVTLSGEPIGELVEIRLRNSTRTDARARTELATKPILFSDLEAGPNGRYEVEVLPASYERRRRHVEIHADKTTDLCVVFHGKHPVCPPSIPDQLGESALASELSTRLAGKPADGSAAPATTPTKVIWVDQGDEVLVHLDSMAVRIMDRIVLVSVDLETDQTGRTPLIVSFSVGGDNDPAGLVSVTDEFPRGNGLLASRWGRALQAAAWASVLGIANDHAAERGLAPLGIVAASGTLSLKAGPPLKVTGT